MPDISEPDLKHLTGGFLSAVQRQPIGGAIGRSGVIMRARYDAAAFRPDLFETLDIPCPARIAAAIAKRQADFLAGRMMAKLAQQALGLPPCPVAIGANRAPVWPDGLAGSISHARGFCASIAVPSALGTPGIDIEAIAQARSQDAILRIALSQPERNLMQDPSARMPVGTLAALCFSAKETLFKALFPTVGHHFGFGAAQLRRLPDQGRLSLFLTQDLHADLRAGQRFDICYDVGAHAVLTWLLHPGSARAPAA